MRRPVAILCLVAAAQLIHAEDHTHFDNHSKKWTIVATTSYPGGHSGFTNRKIAPGGSDVDEYNPVDHVDVTVGVDGAQFTNHFTIPSDASVIATDNPTNQYGVDFWLNDGKGNPVTSVFGGINIPPLVTIFGPGPPPTPSPSPSPTPAPLAPRGALYWDSVQDQGCSSPGYRKKTAHLVGSSSRSNWNADCKATPFSPSQYETLSGDDTSCSDEGLFSGEWGTWQVWDSACMPTWGSFQDDGCKSKGFRQYSSVLWGIPNGANTWENWCKVTPADIKGVGKYTEHFYQPDRCVNTGLNIWGQFDYPDNSCCSNTGNPTGKHDEFAGAGSRKLLVFPPRCDALAGPGLPVLAAAFLLGLLRNVRDQAEIQLRNTAIQALQPPANQAGLNPRVSTRFWERDVYEAGSNGGRFRDDYRVPVFQAFPATVNPGAGNQNYLPTPTDTFDATWVPQYTVGQGPLNTPAFSLLNPNGVIDIPASAFVRIDRNGPNVLLTTGLTGCAFVWAYDSANDVLYAAHIQPLRTNINPWAQTGTDLATALQGRARFHGTELTVNVYGRGGFGYVGTNGNIMAVRNGNTWEIIAQELGVDRAVPTDVQNVDYDSVQPDS